MTTTELKQRIAEAIKPFWGNYIIGRDVCQLLQDCLKHIEEVEQNKHWLGDLERIQELEYKVSELQSQLRERDEALSRANALIGSQADANDKLVQSLNAQLSEREADCAAMRGALKEAKVACESDEHPQSEYALTLIEKALSTTAGRELLERLKAVEKERDEWRKTAGERLDLLTKAEGRALELLERLQKAEAAAKEALSCITEWLVMDDDDPVIVMLKEALQPKEAK